MKLTKAIEIVSNSAHRGTTTFNQDYKDAQKILLQAGKRIQYYRKDIPPSLIDLLPGETLD